MHLRRVSEKFTLACPFGLIRYGRYSQMQDLRVASPPVIGVTAFMYLSEYRGRVETSEYQQIGSIRSGIHPGIAMKPHFELHKTVMICLADKVE